MQKHGLTLAMFVLACGALPASAQQTGNPMMQAPAQQQPTQRQELDEPWHRGMMGWHRRESGMGDIMGGRAHMMMMRMMFSLMDADGDGKLSLDEYKAAHERIFKAMDTDHDGTVTLEEMLAFMHGVPRPVSRP